MGCHREQNPAARIVTPANPGSGPGQAPGSSLALRRIESCVSRTWIPASAGMTARASESGHAA